MGNECLSRTRQHTPNLFDSGWLPCFPQCKNLKEAVDWMKAGSVTKKLPPKKMDKPSSKNSTQEIESADEDDNGEEGADESAFAIADEEDACGSRVQTETHTYKCNRNGLYNKSYAEVVAVKTRLNKQCLAKLCLPADMKGAIVTPPKSESLKKKKKKTPPTEVCRSARIVPSGATPNYAEDDAAEESEVEKVKSEEERSEEASDLEEVEQQEEYESEQEGYAETLDDEDDVTTAAQMGRWGQKFLQLLEYREEHGNCKVPQKYAKNRSLRKWVDHQRQGYKKRKKRENSPMTDEKILMLERIGFYWGTTREEPYVSWDTRFEELKKHEKIFGKESYNSLVHSDYKTCSALGKWISWQRRTYHAMKSGKKIGSVLKEEQVELLNDIDFDWDGPVA